jgi:L-alanine-DL-glutamate epimerase-like enolase superfamily enzyme
VERTIDSINADPALLGDDPFAITPVVGRLIERFNDQRAAIAAVDAALHDWVGRRLRVPVWRLLGLDPRATLPTSMTIGLDEPEVIAQKAREARGFGHLKVKVGTDRDIETLAIIRECAPEARLRLDANCGWAPDEALDRIRELERFEPELIEQPIEAGLLDALRALHAASPVPVFVDEDCATPADIRRVAGCATGVNVKLAKCGGIREALSAINLARAFGLKVMIGCMAESSLGVAAAVQLGSLADVVDLDGHLLMRDDPFDALDLDGDRVSPTDRPGLGADAASFFEDAP